MKPDKICDENFSIGKYFNNVINIVKRKLNTILFSENQFIVSDFPNKSNTAKIELNIEYLENLLGGNKNLQEVTTNGNITQNDIIVRKVFIGNICGDCIEDGIKIYNLENSNSLLDITASQISMTQQDIGLSSQLRLFSKGIVFDFNLNGNESRVDFSGTGFVIQLTKPTGLFKRTLRLPEPINNLNETKTLPISVNNNFSDQFGNIDLPEIKYYTGTITQSDSNLPIITTNVTDANNINLIFNITQIVPGYCSVQISSNEISNMNDHITKIFIEDNIVNSENIENLKTDIIKYETTYNVVNIYTFRNNVPQNNVLNNRFTIHLYKK